MSMPEPDPAALRDHLHRDAPAFGELAAALPAEAPVPGCPGWEVAELAGHLGGVHRWASAVLRCGQLRPEPEPVGDPIGWYAAGWPPLLDVLGGVDPTTPCWGFGPTPHTAGFWTRRMAHETALHLVDLQLAAGLPPSMPDDLAVDGIDEVLEVMAPRQVARGRAPADPPAVTVEWGSDHRLLGAGPAKATIHGGPLDLLLLLWKRRPLETFTVEGDRAAAAMVVASSLTP